MKHLLLVLSLALSFISNAQELSEIASDSLDNIMEEQVDQLINGDINGLFYFANLLNDKAKMQKRSYSRRFLGSWYWQSVKEEALYKIERYTDFKKISRYLSGLDTFLTKEQFYDYFEKHKDDIYFSPFLQLWMDIPLEKYEIQYRLTETSPKTSIFSNVKETADFIRIYNEQGTHYRNDFTRYIEKIGASGMPIARECLFDYHKRLLNRPDDKGDNYNYNNHRAIARALVYFEDTETLDTLFQILEASTGQLYKDALFSIQVLTNFDASTRTKDSTQFRRIYYHLLDSLGSLNAFQKFGYNQLTKYRGQDFGFDREIDYFGTILLDRTLPRHLRYRAYKDMLQLKHPKMLAYLASICSDYFWATTPFYHFWDEEQEEVLNIMSRLTRMQLELPKYDFYDEKFTDEWVWVTNGNSDFKRHWYKIYWYNHYQDYVWSEEEQVFKNVKDDFTPYNQLDTWFEELKAENPNIVINALKSIAESDNDITTIEQQIQKVEDKYGNSTHDWTNQKVLPYHCDKSIIQLAKFYQYCKKHDIVFQPSEATQPIIDQLLSNDLKYAERYTLENELIPKLTISDINALEWLNGLYEEIYRDFYVSVYRILDIWYTLNWEKISKTNEQIIWYLKKSAFLDPISVYPYKKRWKNISHEKWFQIKKIQTTTTDEALKEQINKLLPDDLKANYSKALTDLKYIFNHFEEFEMEDLYRTSFRLTTKEDYDFIFQQLDVDYTSDTLYFIFDVIEENLDIAMTPYLIERMEDYRSLEHGFVTFFGTSSMNYLVADEMIKHLEELYEIAMPMDDERLDWLVDDVGFYRGTFGYHKNRYLSAYHWKNLWEKDSINYQNWSQLLYKERIANFHQRDSLSVEDLNWLFNSPYYSDDQYDNLLPLIKLLNPCREIHEVDLPNIFINKTVLDFFNGCKLYDEDKFRRAFRPLPWEEVFPIILSSIHQEKRLYQFESYKSLLGFDRTWWYDEYLMTHFKDTILAAFDYKKTLYPDKKCENNCQRILFHIKHYNASPVEYMKALLQIEDEELVKELFEELQLHWTYEDLKEVLPFYMQLHFSDSQLRDYLNRYADLFITEFTRDSLMTLHERMMTMTREEVYWHYLKVAGFDIDFTDTLEAYRQIYNGLKFDHYNCEISPSFFCHYPSHIKMLTAFVELHFAGQNTEKEYILPPHYTRRMKTMYRQVRWLRFLEREGYADENLMNKQSFTEWLVEEDMSK